MELTHLKKRIDMIINQYGILYNIREETEGLIQLWGINKDNSERMI